MEQSKYNADFDPFAKRHYIKTFEKTHKSKWEPTKNAILAVCMHIDNILRFKRADLIKSVDVHKLIKLDFAIAGTKISPKDSGNRCILHVNEETRFVNIMLVYSKNEITSPHETQKWQKIIKDNFGELRTIFNL